MTTQILLHKPFNVAFFNKKNIDSNFTSSGPYSYIPLHRIISVLNKPHFIRLLAFHHSNHHERRDAESRRWKCVNSNFAQIGKNEKLAKIWILCESSVTTDSYKVVGKARPALGKTLALTSRKENLHHRLDGIHKYSFHYSNIYFRRGERV